MLRDANKNFPRKGNCVENISREILLHIFLHRDLHHINYAKLIFPLVCIDLALELSFFLSVKINFFPFSQYHKFNSLIISCMWDSFDTDKFNSRAVVAEMMEGKTHRNLRVGRWNFFKCHRTLCWFFISGGVCGCDSGIYVDFCYTSFAIFLLYATWRRRMKKRDILMKFGKFLSTETKLKYHEWAHA